MRPDPNEEPRLFDGIRKELDPKSIQRTKRTGCGVAIFMLLIVLAVSLTGPFTEWLWYVHDARQPQVFTLGYTVRGWLFLSVFLPMWALLYFSLKIALEQTQVLLDRPDTAVRQAATQAIRVTQDQGMGFVRYAAPILAFFHGLGFSAQWQTYLLSRSGGEFGRKDPLFGLDLGFFVFDLPWWQAVAATVFGVLVMTLIATVALSMGLQAMAAVAKIELGSTKVRTLFSALIGSLLIVTAVRAWLATYDFGTMNSAQFTGAGFAAMHQLNAMRVVAVVLLLGGAATLLSGFRGTNYRTAAGSLVAAALTFGIGVLAWPGLVQRIMVEPDKINKESPFARRAIESTRWAFGIDDIEDVDSSVTEEPNPKAFSAARFTLDNMRLWDPEIYRQAIQSLQGLRSYYAFHDVDLDRYNIGGRSQAVMLSPRDILTQGLQPDRRTWVSERLVYTHGFGIAMSPVNRASKDGKPVFLARDVPVNAVPELKLEQPRIYFSDFRGAFNERNDPWVIVGTGMQEFDYPAEGDEARTYRWTGDRGIPVSGIFARAAFSLRFGDGNLLVSGNIRSGSRLLMRRNIVDRATRTYPFLRFDRDPYIVAFNGRLKWILDAYTSTDRIPYSSQVGQPGVRTNYLRNSVKVAIDAYSGEMTAYAIEPEEPILRAWRAIYPNLVKDASQIPAGLNAHFRYPDDLFLIQAVVLSQYHVTDPQAFLENRDAWEIPFERGLQGDREMMRPYYVQIELPDGTEGFHLILPFTPNDRPNMSGWLAAACDPDRYGKLTLYRYTRGSTVFGPSQMESFFAQNEEIANINRQFNNDQSEVIVGNLLVIPIGGSVMYAEPMFLRSRTPGIPRSPELRKVILAFKNRVVVGNTYEEALNRLQSGLGSALATTPATPTDAGDATQTTTTPAPSGTGPLDAASLRQVREALQTLDRADEALRAGDFARYGELQRQAREQLRRLADR